MGKPCFYAFINLVYDGYIDGYKMLPNSKAALKLGGLALRSKTKENCEFKQP